MPSSSKPGTTGAAAGRSDPGAAGGDGAPRSFVGLLAVALRRRRLLVGLPLGVAAAAVLFSLVSGAEYTAESRLLPEKQGEMPADLAGLAAQFGLSMGGAGQGESVDFYAELLGSNELLRAVALTEYAFLPAEAGDSLRGDLLTLYDIDGETREERVLAAIGRLRDDDVVAIPVRTADIVELRTAAPWPALAEAINRRMLDLVNRFNLERRQSRAVEEREFLEARVAGARADLLAAETELQRFMSSNRRYTESPETLFEYGRLQRRVDFLQQLHTSLAQGLEQARVDAVRNTPVITVIDRPEGTAIQTAPNLVINALLGLLLGGALALAIVLGGEAMTSARRANPAEYSELRQVTRETMGDLLSIRGLRRFGVAAGMGGRGTGGPEPPERGGSADPARTLTGNGGPEEDR